jgi:hypothetical protein
MSIPSNKYLRILARWDVLERCLRIVSSGTDCHGSAPLTFMSPYVIGSRSLPKMMLWTAPPPARVP